MTVAERRENSEKFKRARSSVMAILCDHQIESSGIRCEIELYNGSSAPIWVRHCVKRNLSHESICGVRTIVVNETDGGELVQLDPRRSLYFNVFAEDMCLRDELQIVYANDKAGKEIRYAKVQR